MLFMRICGETIRFATHLRKTQNQQEKTLLADIHYLENTFSQTNSALLEDKKNELENIRNEKIKGYITRGRMQW